jgi:hypothetical protein
MPGPQLTSLPLRSAPRPPVRPSGTSPGACPRRPAEPGTWRPSPLLPRPGAHLLGSGFRRSSSLAAECGAAAAAAAAAAAFAASTAAAATKALPGAPPGLEAGDPRGPRRRGPGARQRRAAGSCRCEAQRERGASHRLPSSHNFAAWVGARSGAAGGERGRGGEVAEAGGSSEQARREPERSARKRDKVARGRRLLAPRGARPGSV